MSSYGKSDRDTTKGGDLSVSGTGLGGNDPAHKKAGKKFENKKFEAARTLDKRQYIPETLYKKKERVGFGGGFRIPEAYREKRLARSLRNRIEDDSTDEEKETSLLTKEEIMAQLNLGEAQMNFGQGKNTKNALTNDLVEGLEKDIEKLKQKEKNITTRMRTLQGDKTVNEREKDIELKRFHNLDRQLQEEGGNIYPFAMGEPRVQALRHQPGQLNQVEDLEKRRIALREEERQICEAMGLNQLTSNLGSSIRRKNGYGDDEDDEAEEIGGRRRRKQSRGAEGDSPPTKMGGSRRSKSRKSVVFEDEDHLMRTKSSPTRGGKEENEDDFGRKKSVPKWKQKTHDDLCDGSDSDPVEDVLAGRPKQKKTILKKRTQNWGSDEDDEPQQDTEKPAKRKVSVSVPGEANKYNTALARQSRTKSCTDKRTPYIPNGTESSRDRRFIASQERQECKEALSEIASPRRMIFEAKFTKYVSNKMQKKAIEKRVMTSVTPKFDITTKHQSSPSKWKAHFKENMTKSIDQLTKEEELMPEGYEDYLMREEVLKQKQKQAKTTHEDQFKMLGVNNEDKMTFFLLKWVFNAIKQESDKNDMKLKGKDFCDRKELVKQLAKNTELMHALEYTSSRELWKKLRLAVGVQKDLLTWDEYLDFFFIKKDEYCKEEGRDWWNKVDKYGKAAQEETPEKESNLDTDSDKSGVGSADSKQKRKRLHDALLGDLNSVNHESKSLKLLIASRRNKTIEEVEQEFNDRMEAAGFGPEREDGETDKGFGMANLGKKAPKKGGKKNNNMDLMGADLDMDAMQDSLGFMREKSKNLLLPSQMELMEEVYKQMDTYDDEILRRSEFIMQLRSDSRIVDFIDQDAVKIAGVEKDNILNLEAVLSEIEKDEQFERQNLKKGENDICHREFITFREFKTYFDDYRIGEERNKKANSVNDKRKNLNKNKGADDVEIKDPKEEMKLMMEKEKERRLAEIPHLRPADEIDIPDDQVKLIKDIFIKQIPKDGSKVHKTVFFVAIRKHPKLKAISSTLARDPQGHARLPKETFGQVFDRMERDIETKNIEWETIIEYFTKRGKPLSKDEIQALIAEDRRLKEEQEEQTKRELLRQRTREARLTEDMQGDDDFEAYKLQQKVDHADEGCDFEEDEEAQSCDDSQCSDKSDYDRDYDSEDDDRRDDLSDDEENKNGDFCCDKDLGRGRLTANDYKNEVGKSLKKMLTVPKPFDFDSRDIIKPKTIRERKVEAMVNEKLEAEEKMLKHQFKRKPIPPEVTMSLFKNINERAARKSEMVRRNAQALTAQNEKPFSFWADIKRRQSEERNPDYVAGELPPDSKRPAFKANPIPVACSITNFEESRIKAEQEREQRIRKMAEISKSKAKMPARMQRDEDKKSQQKAKVVAPEYSFKPKINEAKTAEQMIKMQQAFQDQLALKKGQSTKTVFQPFNFKESKSRPLERSQYNEGGPKAALGKSNSMMDPFAAALAKKVTAKKSQMSQSQTNFKPPNETKAMALGQAARRKQIEALRAKEEQKIKDDKARYDKQNRLKTVVQANMAGKVNNAKQQVADKVAQAKKDMRENEAKRRAELKERVENARKGPMLSEGNTASSKSANLAKLVATKKVLEAYKESGLSEAYAMRTFTDEQKDLLNEEKFLQQKKQNY